MKKYVMKLKDKPSDSGYIDYPDLFERISIIRRGQSLFNRSTGVALSSLGEIYVSDSYGNTRVYKFSPDGKLLLSWGELGSERSQFQLTHSIWVDKQDRIWISDRENSRIQIFSANGEFLVQWTYFIRPTDVFIDDEDTAYVSELCKRVIIFSIYGTLLARWDNEGKDWESLLLAPYTIAVDSNGDLYVGEISRGYAKVDRGSRTLQKFTRVET